MKRLFLYASITLASAMLSACGSTPEKVAQEPVVITVPEYLLVVDDPTPPPDQLKFELMSEADQKTALYALIRSLYKDYDLLGKQILTIKQRQLDLLKEEAKHVR